MPSLWIVNSPAIVILHLILSLWCLSVSGQVVSPGVIQNNVPWKAGHASVFQDPHVIIYGGTTDTGANYTNAQGSKSVWVWNSQNGTWYDAQTLSSGTNGFSPQVFFRAVTLPSSGQSLFIASNTSGGGALLQKLDSTVWSWNSPTSTNPPSSASGYTLALLNNTIYMYGGVSVDANGARMSGAVLNSLTYLDADSFLWSPGSNGPAVTDHSTCYIPSCNCLVTFGGTETGDPSQPSRSVYTYDIGARAWNLQVNPGSVNGAIPGPRRLHTATCLQDRMVVYGGGTTAPFDSDVWILDASKYPDLTWTRQPMANASQGPGARMGHSAVLDAARRRIYIYGGWTGGATNDNTMYILDIEKSSWASVSPTGMPPSASSSSSATSGGDGGGTNSTPVGAIAGGVVGGVLGLAALALAAFFFLRRRKRQQHNEQRAMEKDMDDNSQDDYYWRYGDGVVGGGGHDYQDDHHTYSLSDPAHHSSDAKLAATPYSHKRVSKAWTSRASGTMRDSFGRRSEAGDVQSSVMEMISSPSSSHQDLGIYGNNLRGSRHSLPTSKILLATELDGPGQVPNEYVLQKPNEFSVPASRFAAQNSMNDGNNSVPIDHHTSTGSSQVDLGAPLSSSMEVLRSIKTDAPGSRNINVTHAYAPRSEDDDNYNDEDSVRDDTLPTSPIQYIPGASKQFSIATTVTNSTPSQMHNHSTTNNNVAVPLTHHHYPSSSVPVAHPLPPQRLDENGYSTGPRVAIHSFRPLSGQQQQQQQPLTDTIYDSVSPLDWLSALGQGNGIVREERTAKYFPTSSDDKTMIPPTTTTTPISPLPTPLPTDESPPEHLPSSSTLNTDPPSDQTDKHLSISGMLPRRYRVDTSKAPLRGLANSILFVFKSTDSDQETPAVVKNFGRREAWERECRTLMKLKSQHVVTLLEVLTIQDESSSNSSSSSQATTPHSMDARSNDGEEDDSIKYVTVLERLDETLASAIRRSRPDQPTIAIARDIIQCLIWCHEKGIAFCDLKPSNIMHNVNMPWKLIDFEASRTIGEECVGVITPRYCPPEVARATTYGLEGANGVVATASVDLWALGCVLYELETKRPLFSSTIKDETILHFVSHPSSSTPILNNGLRWNELKELEIPQLDRTVMNEHGRKLIKMLLSRDPAKRGSASQLLTHPYFTESG